MDIFVKLILVLFGIMLMLAGLYSGLKAIVRPNYRMLNAILAVVFLLGGSYWTYSVLSGMDNVYPTVVRVVRIVLLALTVPGTLVAGICAVMAGLFGAEFDKTDRIFAVTFGGFMLAIAVICAAVFT